jgi:hypothetical protein
MPLCHHNFVAIGNLSESQNLWFNHATAQSSRLRSTFDLQSRCYEKCCVCNDLCRCLPDRLQQARASGTIVERDAFGQACGCCATEAAGILRSERHQLRAPRRPRRGGSTENRRRLRYPGKSEQAPVLRRLRHAGDDGGRRRKCRRQALHGASARRRSIGGGDQRRLPSPTASRFQRPRHLLCPGRYGVDGSRTPSRHYSTGDGKPTRGRFYETACQQAVRGQRFVVPWRRVQIALCLSSSADAQALERRPSPER